MRTIVIPEVRIEEKTVEVIPLKTQEELATLQVNVKKLEKDLEAQKEAIPVSTQKKLESLQKQLDKLKEEKKQQEEEHAQQEKRIKKLSEDANLAIRKREFAENADRIRQGWRLVNSEAHTCLMRLLGQWPTPVDAQTFDADDWAHVDHMEKTLQRVLDEYKSLRYSGGIIEDHASPYALSLNGHYIVESEMSHPD